MEQRLMAFWTDSTPPYFNGGEVEAFEDCGRVRTKQFPGYLFTPVQILPLERGQVVKDELKRLQGEVDRQIKSAKDSCKTQAYSLLGIPHPTQGVGAQVD